MTNTTAHTSTDAAISAPATSAAATTDPTHADTDRPRLVVLVGSTRRGRFCPVPADWFAAEARAHGALSVEVLDLTEFDLPQSLDTTPDVTALGERLAAADGFVVVTPEYNHSFPSALKTAIDHYHSEWQAKPVAFVSYGGMGGGLRAVEQLRLVFAELHAVTMRNTVSFHNYPTVFGEDGTPADAASASAAAKQMLDQLAWWAVALRRARAEHPYST
ncbi:NADPH-dependent FMN reductase [Saccharomonospora iraqiensis]|uniref:NADPH-dependent FMN reductase n=1 Tax=Saccharomonospora iraqiensis TaxID=52698 RepID=UPI00022E071F|nr:NAD(P)H-dependent oxidoreductase [Saccharomonospora iraqiensis]